MNLKPKPLSPQEEDELYGMRIHDVGSAFKREDEFNQHHYYLQRENDVLHLNINNAVLNTLHEGYLNKCVDKEDITNEEFTMMMKKFIYENELEKYWISK